MVFSCFGSGRHIWQLQASKASFLVASESDVRHWHRGLGSAVGTGMPWCFPVSEAAAKAGSCRLQRLAFYSVQKVTLGTGVSCFGSGRERWQLQASKASFLVGSESDVRHWHRGLGSAVGTGMPWCFPVSEAAAKAGSCRLQRLVF